MFRKLASFARGQAGHKDSYVKESYSQCGEDLIIDHIINAVGITKPSYIDIGAHHPMHINNTYRFYLTGSRGINIEPNPELFREFERIRPEDCNLNFGISDVKGEAPFYIMNQPTLSSFVKDEVDRAMAENPGLQVKEVRNIKIVPIMEIIREYNNGVYPDILSMDVEGLDEKILHSINYESSSPKIMCVETLTYSTTRRGVKKTALIEFVKSKGYMLYADTYINTIFVREDTW